MSKQREHCIACSHFHNTPAFLEDAYKGLSTFSSGYASVRKDDGICTKRDLYLSADGWCEGFEARRKTG